MRRLRIVVAVIALGLAWSPAGCSGASPASGTGGGSPGAGSADDRLLAFARCLREHGVDVPDPDPDGGFSRVGGPDDTPDEIEKAMQACEQYRGDGGEATRLDAQQQEQVRQFAACMRENGVPDFPDPDPEDGGLDLQPGQNQDPAFQSAFDTCRSKLPAGVRHGGS